MSEDDLITVCDACEQASCWHGIFFCEDYKVAGVKQMTRAALTAKGVEHPSYWKTDQEWAKEWDADAHKWNEAARERRKPRPPMTDAVEKKWKHKDPRDPVLEALLMGLITDGAHHKQYHLEQALNALTSPEWAEAAKQHFQWQEGIPS